MRILRVLSLAIGLALVAAFLPAVVTASQAAPPEQDHQAGGFLFVKTLDQAVCQTVYTGGLITTHYMRGECIRMDFSVTNTTADSPVAVEVEGPDGTTVGPFDAVHRSGSDWRMVERSDAAWPAGELTARVLVDGANVGEATLYHNLLSATVTTDQPSYAPGDPITVSGTIVQVSEWTAPPPPSEAAAATATIRLLAPDGETILDQVDVTADGTGDFDHTFPASATSGVDPTRETGFALSLGVAVVDASHTEPTAGVPGSGEWYAARAGSGAVKIVERPDELILENRFVSSTGWVEPGERYPFRVFVRNFTSQTHTNAEVTIPAPDAVAFVDAVPLRADDTVSVSPDSITWNLADLSAGTVNDDGELVATVATLVVDAQAASSDDDPRIVWKDLSSTASLTYAGFAETLTSESHGPKVIPPAGGYETARYGDKPFPMVAAEYTDRTHQPGNTNEKLDRVVNDPDFAGSTFNLYQEMSYGQLFPEGTVPSLGLASADFSYDDPDFDGWHFSEPDRTRDCRGHTWGEGGSALVDSPLYDQRIRDGWYQLPGNTEYYGGDYPAFTLGIGSSIDSACGPLGKAVYDAAHIADPEIDYNQYDSDKDGVVDFFMLVFVGCGGNGASQVSFICPYDDVPYDNIWPHSSTLEMQFKDEDTGLRGYTSDDQLTDLEGTPQCWLTEQRLQSDDCSSHDGSGDDTYPVYVRVGPYNVNPETALDSASVISHEYGHHLGLPDYYRSGHDYYADWNLMAADYSQHMTVFSKQELGWVVPRPVQPGDEITVDDWWEIKHDTGEIHWVQPDGTPYTLSAAEGDQNVHNGLSYAAKLPQRQILDPQKVEDQASPVHVWWSGRGNDFGCPPAKGHNLDIYLPELTDVADGTPVTLTFKSSWDIEWDWDYGFLFTSPDGANYTSQPSENGYTTDNAYNPNNQQCFEEHDNGLTGTSGSYQAGTESLDRNPAAHDYSRGSPFLVDEYDISELAGSDSPVVRFSYFTDAAFDRPGWFIDDVEVTAGDEVIYRSDFESGDEEGRIFSGGCDADGIDVAVKCTVGWNKIRSDAAAPFDHAYYLELRDQSGFDYDGHGQSDRGDTAWAPGLLVEYTDEAHGYGNNGVAYPPAQHYLDSQPRPGEECPVGNCADAAFTAAEGDSVFSDAVTIEQPEGWIDNFEDPDNGYEDDEFWHFDHGCLGVEVLSMAGNGIGPAPPAPSDLTADVRLTGGEGCRTFEFLYSGAEGATNSAPTADAQAKPQEAPAGEPVTFDGSRSFDPDGDALTYSWDFDASDGIQQDASGETVTHRYEEPGDYTVTLTVDDGNGGTDTDTLNVRITEATEPAANRPPQAAAEATTRVVLGDEVTFDARGSSDPDGDTLDFQWAFGDGETDAGALVEHAYASRGDKTATVTVRDGRGGKDTASASTRVVEVDRVFGVDRIGTAIDVARERFDLADEVVLATATTYADALSGAPFAAQRRAPILLNPQGTLHPDVRAAIEELGARTVHLLGGTHALSQTVQDELEQMGLAVGRFAGSDRFDTARLIATEVGGTDVYIAEGADADPFRGWPDAMIASPVAATTERPILLVTTESVPEATHGALDELGVDSATVVGGTVAVSQAVEDELQARGVAVGRVAGIDRFDTSRLMAERAQTMGMSAEETWLSRGDNWPDSLTAGPVVGDTGGILLLVDRSDLDVSAPSREWLEDAVADLLLVRLLGGDHAITPAVEADVEDLIRSR